MTRSFLSEIQRKAYFFSYNVRPFRLSLFANHVYKRVMSALHLRQGFRIIDLAITYRCNLDCRHCSALIMEDDASGLSLEDYKDIVAQAKKLDNLSWNITGGEPLVVDWLEDLIPILEPARHYISIQTNCLLLTEEKARKLARLGVNCITTSIDSVVPDEHNDFRRRNNAYEETLEGLKNARKAGMGVLIGGTITHQNLRSENTRRLVEKANALGAMFLFNLAIPCGNWKGNNDIVLRDDDREYLYRLLAEYPRSTTDHEVARNIVGCPAGMEKIYITPYGDVLPCPFIHISFGNVLESPLSDIIERMRQVPQFGSYPGICVAAEDLDFHKEIFTKIYSPGQKQFPVSCDKIYKLKDD